VSRHRNPLHPDEPSSTYGFSLNELKKVLLENNKIIMSQLTVLLAPIVTSLNDIQTDIVALQGAAGGGGLSTSDQAAIASLATQVSSIQTALDALAAAATPPASS
jgi:hypothetical protein